MKGLNFVEKFQSIYTMLMERNKESRIMELTAKLKQSKAEPEELSELVNDSTPVACTR